MGWIDERLQISPILRAFVDRKLPGNIGWAHTLGSATILFLIVQIATGIVLTLSYVPSPSAAYESVLYIDQTPFGALVRGVHHWTASLLVILVVVEWLSTTLTHTGNFWPLVIGWGAYLGVRVAASMSR